MKKMLIIEDSVDSAEMLSMLLEFQGHSVQCASSARAGISLAGTLSLDFIITDLGLPDMDGPAIIRELSRVRTATSCVVVALTGRDGAEIRREALEAGADYFFVKGDEISSLLALFA